MKILRIYNEDLSVDVQYKVDIVVEGQENFTVMEVTGLDDAERELGISFRQLPYTLSSFVAFCEDNGFGLSAQFIGTPVDQPAEVLVEPEAGDDDEGEGDDENGGDDEGDDDDENG